MILFSRSLSGFLTLCHFAPVLPLPTGVLTPSPGVPAEYGVWFASGVLIDGERGSARGSASSSSSPGSSLTGRGIDRPKAWAWKGEESEGLWA
jgi:hypothetical protein